MEFQNAKLNIVDGLDGESAANLKWILYFIYVRSSRKEEGSLGMVISS